MIYKRHLFVPTLVLVGILLGSCGSLQEVQLSSIESARLINASMKGIEAELSVGVKNPNRLGFTVTKSDMSLQINNVPLGEVQLANKIRIKKKSDDIHTFRIKADPGKALGGGILTLASIMQKKTVEVQINGFLHVRSFLFFKRKVPIDLKRRVDLQK